jgi:hypothetical protein
VRPQFGLAHMHGYRLFVYSEDGQLIGAAKVIHAANDADAIAQAEAMRGPRSGPTRTLGIGPAGAASPLPLQSLSAIIQAAFICGLVAFAVRGAVHSDRELS